MTDPVTRLNAAREGVWHAAAWEVDAMRPHPLKER